MNNIFYEMKFKRKSFHIFRNVGTESIGEYELGDIQNAYAEFTPLNPKIKTAIRIVPEKEAAYIDGLGNDIMLKNGGKLIIGYGGIDKYYK